MSPDDPRKRAPGRHSRPVRPPRDDEYNDINWDDDDDALFNDETARGEIGLADYVTKKRIITVAAIFVSIILVFSVFTWIRSKFVASGPQGGEVTLEVPVGASLNSFSNTLESKNVIPSAFGMRLYLKTHSAPRLQAGEYVFHTNSSPKEALADIKIGPKQSTDRLVIPEGYRVAQIAQLVGRIPGFSEKKFLDLANSGTVRSEFQPTGQKNMEGFLFPDTYLLSSRDTEQTLLERMRNEFDSTARSIGLDRSDRAIGYSPYETLTIASMIESEAKVDVDRGKISQVIENRLNAAMPLGIDATVLYGLGNTKTTLSGKDLKTNTPYNTRLNKGLPPTPISNPGKKSLQAALAPTPGPWLYYVIADKDGSHAFATTLEEHNKNVEAARAKGLL